MEVEVEMEEEEDKRRRRWWQRWLWWRRGSGGSQATTFGITTGASVRSDGGLLIVEAGPSMAAAGGKI